MSNAPAAPLLRLAPATVHGRYLVAPPLAPLPSNSPTSWLVAFHGYAQSAEVFLPLLARVPRPAHWLAASVQALHPFYAGRSTDVVANWMTRQDREHAIVDNIAYVDTVLDQLQGEFGPPRAIVLAGFSQGVAMAFRAALRGKRACAGLITAGGDVPPELKVDAVSQPWPRVLMCTGTADEWYSPERLEQDMAFVRTYRPDARTCVFSGGHEWSDALVAAAGELIAQVDAVPAG